MDTLLIINPTSGQGKAAKQKRRLTELAAKMPDVDVKLTAHPDHAFELAADAGRRGYERVLVAGGDGTINQVVNGIGDSQIPLGIIPLGTGNVLAHDLRIPHNNIRAALAIIQSGKVRNVDLARAGGRRFVLMAGFGFDAAVIDDVSPRVKDVLGTMAYAPALIKQFFSYRPVRFRLEFVDRAPYEAEAFAVVVANCGSYAYNFKIAPEAVFDDGLLDVLVFDKIPKTRLELIGHALESMFQQRMSDVSATYFRTTGVRVVSDPSVKMQLDGDVCGESEVDIEVIPKALSLIVP